MAWPCGLKPAALCGARAAGLGRWGLLAIALGATLLAGCTPGQLDIRLSPDVRKPEKALLFFFVDGLDRQRLYAMLNAGELPNLQRLFVNNGVQVRHAVTSLPSVTYPNCTSLITGVYPGHHGILGNYWFDRYSLTSRDYMTLSSYRTSNEHFFVPTLYDALHDHITLNIQNHTRRGVTHTIDNAKMFAWSWIVGSYTRADYHVGESLEDAARFVNRVGHWPTVIMTYYPGVDEVGHQSGSQTAEYGDALRNLDTVIGMATTTVEQAGMADRMYYCLVTDHSHPFTEPGRQIDLLSWLTQARRLKMQRDVVDDPSFKKRQKTMQPFDSVGAIDAGRVAMIHLRGREGWLERPSPEEAASWLTASPSVLELPAVEMVATRGGEDRAWLLSRRGRATVERSREGGVRRYRVIDIQGDPLQAADRPALTRFVEAGWHTSREWLAATAETPYPDLPSQVVDMFDSPRTADLVIMAAPGWSFGKGKGYAGGHGSCCGCDMHVPMMFAGPDLPRGAAIDYGRLVDVMPTALGLLGEARRLEKLPPIDGIDLSGEIRNAGSRPARESSLPPDPGGNPLPHKGISAR